jgi:cytochrome P450
VAGSYVPWAAGPRVCPGKKFSQVEFVAVLSSVLKGHRVRPVLVKGESDKDASERLLRVIRDSYFEIAIKMKHPEELTVRWEKRTG